MGIDKICIILNLTECDKTLKPQDAIDCGLLNYLRNASFNKMRKERAFY